MFGQIRYREFDKRIGQLTAVSGCRQYVLRHFSISYQSELPVDGMSRHWSDWLFLFLVGGTYEYPRSDRVNITF